MEKARLDKILANNEIRTLITAIGPGVVSALKGDGEGETESEESPSEIRSNTAEALRNLGYKDGEIRTVLDQVFKSKKEMTLEDAIRETLAAISR